MCLAFVSYVAEKNEKSLKESRSALSLAQGHVGHSKLPERKKQKTGQKGEHTYLILEFGVCEDCFF